MTGLPSATSCRDEHPDEGLPSCLALLLVRRKVLRMAGSRPGVLMVRPRPVKSGGPEGAVIEVVDPAIDDAAVADAIEQLGQVVAPQGAAARQGEKASVSAVVGGGA